MRDYAQGHVLQLVEAFLSRLATYKPTHSGRSTGTAHRNPAAFFRLGTVFREVPPGLSPDRGRNCHRYRPLVQLTMGWCWGVAMLWDRDVTGIGVPVISPLDHICCNAPRQ
jgi:hypothetical protein